MGYEYNIDFEYEDKCEVETILRSAPQFSNVRVFDGRELFEYRHQENTHNMPNGSAELQENSVYYCDYGNSMNTFNHIVEKVAERFGEPKVRDFNE